MAFTYAYADNGNTIKQTRTDTVTGNVTITKYNKRNTSITISTVKNLLEISDLRGSACAEYDDIIAPSSTDIEDLCDQLNTWLDDVSVSATVTIDPAGLATEAKQDTQITNQGAAGAAAPFGSGILGWLRGIWDRLNQFTFTGGDLNVNASLDTTLLAKEAKQDTQITNQGTEGATPPTIAGTGIIGYLRAIYDKLVTGASSIVNFIKDGVTTNVNLDTVDPTNNEPLPTALYNDKGLQGNATNPINTAIRDASTGSRMIVDLNGAAKLGEAIILSGDVLYGQNLSNFLWYDLSINGGATFGAPGEQRLETGTTADGQVILQSRKKSRFMISQFNISHFGVQMEPTGNLADPNCITEIGNVTFLDDAGNLNATPNGIFLRVQGDPVTPQWSVVNVKNGVETVTPYASWNGAQVDNFNPSPNLAVYEIQYNAGTAFFFQGSNFVHRLAGGTSTYAATYNFPVALRIRNINGNTNNNSFGSRAAGAYRLGEERGELISRALTASTLLKTGAGYVGKASLSRTGGGGGNSGIANIYDGVDATGIPIGRIDVSTDDVKGVTLDGTFSNGLYVEIIGAGTNTLTINFE